MSVRIRSASPGDATALVAVYRAAVGALGGDHYTNDERAAWRNAVTEEAMREGVIASETRSFVAEIDERVVGFSTLHEREVRAVYVRPAVQGQGIGAILLGAVEETAATRDIQTLTVAASLNAVGFYERQGYEAVGKGAMDLGGRSIRCVEMEKDIGEAPTD
jgi:putative acetyltransferase